VSYRVQLTGPARRDLGRIPAKAALAIAELLAGPMAENPQRVGKPLIGNLAGEWSARRGEWRILYAIDDATMTVTVDRIAHRRDAYHIS
jgi:mRNA interferase RelE/StbE